MDGTPNNAPAVPIFAVEPVYSLTFRASCICGWWQMLETSEGEAQDVLIRHMLVTKCEGCTEDIEHADVTVVEQRRGAGAYCPDCAPSYAAA